MMQTTTQSGLSPEQIADLAEFDRETQEAAEIINERRRRIPFWQRYQEFQWREQQNPWLEQFITPNPRATSGL